MITIANLHCHQDTGRDLLVSRTGDVETAVWLRKTAIQHSAPKPGFLIDVVCPAELARERGLG